MCLFREMTELVENVRNLHEFPHKSLWGETRAPLGASEKAQLPPSSCSPPQNLPAENPAVPLPAEKSVEALEMLRPEFGVRFREVHVNTKEIHLFTTQHPHRSTLVRVRVTKA